MNGRSFNGIVGYDIVYNSESRPPINTQVSREVDTGKASPLASPPPFLPGLIIPFPVGRVVLETGIQKDTDGSKRSY